MSKERLEVKKEPFADLEKIKIDILKEKIQIGLDSFENNEGQQWTSLRFEKPLLKKMLAILDSIVKLEEERDEWKDTAQSYYVTNQELREQNKRYREALEFYADEGEYYAKINLFDDDESRFGEVYLDEGKTARKALAGEE